MPSPSAPTRCDAGTRTLLERDDRVVVGDGVRVRRCADHADARGRQVDDEHRVLAGVVTTDQLGLEERVRRLVEGRHVPLHAVEQVVVAVASGGGRQVVDVGTRVLLGDGVALLRCRRAPSARAIGSRWYGVATAGSQPGGVAITQASAFVTRPPCSCTSTCCSIDEPTATVLDGDVGRAQAELAGPSVVLRATPGGSSPPVISASTSNGISSSVKARAVALISRSAALRRCIGSPA